MAGPPFTRVYRTNDAGTSVTAAEQNANDGVRHNVSPGQVGEPQDTRAIDISDPSSALQTINWLGSSYSGADIKVVAHLYQPVSYEKQISDLDKQKAICDDIADGLSNLLAGGAQTFTQAIVSARIDGEPFTYTDLVEVWKSGAQVSTETIEEAVLEIVALMVPYRTATRQENIQRGLDMLQKIKDEQASLSAALEEEVRKLRELEENASTTLVLGSLQTISVQSHREKVGVRALGTSYVKGYARGPRTIGGSMIFTLFDEHALKRLLRSMTRVSQYGDSKVDERLSTLMPDQMPPIDITIVFANEYGSFSRMAIYGLEFINDGVTLSIEDLLSEQVLNFVARDIDIMTKVGQMRLSQYEKGMFYQSFNGEQQPLQASDLIFTSGAAYNKYLVQLGLRRGQRGR